MTVLKRNRRFVSLGKVGYIDKKIGIALTDKETRYTIKDGDDIEIGDKILFDKQERKSFIKKEKIK